MAASTPDISQLTSSQQEALQTYTSVTDQDPIAAIPLLQRSEWNVQIAIARFFDGEPISDPLAEARASLPSSSPRQTSNLQYESLRGATSNPGPPRSTSDTVQPIDTDTEGGAQYPSPVLLSALFAPLNLVYRLFRTFLSPFTFLIPTFVYRAFARINAQRSRPTRRPLPPADNARRFIREFSEEYGVHSLPFVESGFNLALDHAKRDLRFLLVVLLSPNHDDNSSWVRETLLSDQFSNFLSSHKDEIILWGGNVQDGEAYQVSDSLKCTKFPFVGLICHSTNVGSTGMITILRVAGPSPASELVAKLGTSMTTHQAQLAVTRAQRAEQQASRNLRQEQDSAYERSLAQDRERARRRREEEEAQARAEKEAQALAEAAERRQQNEEQWKRWRVQSLSNEPDTADRDAIRVSIRMPSGERVIRKFRPEADLEELYAFVECYDILGEDKVGSEVSEPLGYEHKYKFQLVSPMPRKVFTLDNGGSIEEHIGRGANLIVESLEEAESDEDVPS